MSYLPSIPFPHGAEARDPAPSTENADLLRANTEAWAELLAIVTRAQTGDLSAQSELVHRYRRRIFAFVRPIVSPPSAVEDVVQMIFIKMIRRLGLLRDPITFESWLFTVARNTALDYVRRARSRPALVPDDENLVYPGSDTTSRDVSEIMEALEIALVRLSPKDQRIVRSIVAGINYRAIAEREQITVGAVKLRLNRVRPFLRASVGKAIGLTSPARTYRQPPRCRAAA